MLGSNKEINKNPTELRFKIHSNAELYAFLLGFKVSDSDVSTQYLANKIDIEVTSSNQTEKQRKEEAKALRTAAIQKAQRDAEKYRLGDEDKVALEQLYIGFTQADLVEGGNPYEVMIGQGGNTGYALKMPQQSSEEPTDISLSLFGSQDGEKLKTSQALYKALLSEFNFIGLWDKGTQIRRSGCALFRRTAMQAGAIILMPEIEEDPFNYPVVFLKAVPVNRVKQGITGFDTFRRSLSEDNGSN